MGEQSAKQISESRTFYSVLTNALRKTPYSGDGHYLYLNPHTPEQVKITDYPVFELLICENTLPSEELRRKALRLGHPCVLVECETPRNDYMAAIPNTLRPSGFMSAHVLPHMPYGWQEGDPVIWRTTTAGQLGVIALQQPLSEDRVLAGIYKRLQS